MKRIFLACLFLVIAVNTWAYRYVWPLDVKYDISMTEATKGINTVTGLLGADWTASSAFGTDEDGDFFDYKPNQGASITYTATTDIQGAEVYTIQIKVKFTQPSPAVCCPSILSQFGLSPLDGGFLFRGGFEGSADYGEMHFACGYPPHSIRLDDAISYNEVNTIQMVFYKSGNDSEGYYQKQYNITTGASQKYGWTRAGERAGYNSKIWNIGRDTYFVDWVYIKIYQVLIAVGKDYYGTEIKPIGMPSLKILTPDELKYHTNDEIGGF